jgi:hypothetical protein
VERSNPYDRPRCKILLSTPPGDRRPDGRPRLVDLYAHYADRRDAEGQAALFAEDARSRRLPGRPREREPVQLLQGRAKLTDALELLNTFQATTHFIGQHVVDFNEDGATGETHCLAYHLFEHNGQRMLMVMSGPLLRRKPGGDRTASAHRGMASVT